MAEALNFDDIDLNEDPEIEAARLLEITEEAEEEAPETTEETPEAEDVIESGKTSDKEIDPQAEVKRLFEELRSERQKLQEQLNELTVGQMADKRKLTDLEKKLQRAKTEKAKPKEEDPGPTPEQIVNHLDQRIAQLDAALSKAEAEDPASAPAIRQQLRQLERTYNNYITQVTLQGNKGPDPETLVQQAVLETNQQSRFNMVRSHIMSEYPVLDKDSEFYDEALATQIHRVYNPMLKEGEDPAEALLEATALVTSARNIMSVSQLRQVQQQQEAAKAKEEPAKKEPAKAPARKAEAVKRNLEAATAQPPNIANIGEANKPVKLLDKYDLESMSINEFLRLSDDEMSRLEEAALAMYE